jgi:hypothetical protein
LQQIYIAQLGGYGLPEQIAMAAYRSHQSPAHIIGGFTKHLHHGPHEFLGCEGISQEARPMGLGQAKEGGEMMVEPFFFEAHQGVEAEEVEVMLAQAIASPQGIPTLASNGLG